MDILHVNYAVDSRKFSFVLKQIMHHISVMSELLSLTITSLLGPINGFAIVGVTHFWCLASFWIGLLFRLSFFMYLLCIMFLSVSACIVYTVLWQLRLIQLSLFTILRLWHLPWNWPYSETDNTVEENSSIFSLIRMRWLLSARACR